MELWETDYKIWWRYFFDTGFFIVNIDKMLPHCRLLVYFLLTCGCLDVVFAGTTSVDILESGKDGKIVLEGSNLNLTCKVTTPDSRLDEIRWYDNDAKEITQDKYIVTTNDTVILPLANVSGIGIRNYYCGFGSRPTTGIRLYVAIIPKPPKVTCFSRSQENYWCEYEEITDTGLDSNFTMEHTRTESDWCSFVDFDRWTICENTGNNENVFCKPRCKKDRNNGRSCIVRDSRQQCVRVNQTNALGRRSTMINIHPMKDAIPCPVTDLKVVATTSRSLQLSWRKPVAWQYSALNYQVNYSENESLETKTLMVTMSKNDPVVFTLHNLLPYTIYNIVVRSQPFVHDVDGGSNWSHRAYLSKETLQEAPAGPVQNLIFIHSTSTLDPYLRDVNFTWMEVPKILRHGQILGYNIYCKPIMGSVETDFVDDPQYYKAGLDKFASYYISVAATTVEGEGPNATVTLPDLTSSPRPPVYEKPFPIARSPHSIEVRWKDSRDPQGHIEHYLLQWSQNEADWLPDPPKRLSSELNSTVVTGLKPDTNYYFCLSMRNKLAESEKNCLDVPIKTIKETGINAVLIWISLLGVCLLGVCVVFFTYWVKKSDVTKPGPKIFIPKEVKRYQINGTKVFNTIEKEIFDDIQPPPSYDDYVRIRSISSSNNISSDNYEINEETNSNEYIGAEDDIKDDIAATVDSDRSITDSASVFPALSDFLTFSRNGTEVDGEINYNILVEGQSGKVLKPMVNQTRSSSYGNLFTKTDKETMKTKGTCSVLNLEYAELCGAQLGDMYAKCASIGAEPCWGHDHNGDVYAQCASIGAEPSLGHDDKGDTYAKCASIGAEPSWGHDDKGDTYAKCASIGAEPGWVHGDNGDVYAKCASIGAEPGWGHDHNGDVYAKCASIGAEPGWCHGDKEAGDMYAKCASISAEPGCGYDDTGDIYAKCASIGAEPGWCHDDKGAGDVYAKCASIGAEPDWGHDDKEGEEAKEVMIAPGLGCNGYIRRMSRENIIM
ncbi:uncharacterized protein [Amphiura filiformis]|uniref:uncharacterized protein n=1 Tax=Amphiura filiformis TaxID=82378 RepID=UPI003B2286D8